LWSKNTYKYDEKGNNIEDNLYKADGSLPWKHTFKYDVKGNKIEEIIYNASNGSLSSKNTYKYDEKGNNIERNTYDGDGSLRVKNTYKYEFDATDNWIKQTSTTNGKSYYLTERVIEYY
jgi:hypothetical protein